MKPIMHKENFKTFFREGNNVLINIENSTEIKSARSHELLESYR